MKILTKKYFSFYKKSLKDFQNKFDLFLEKWKDIDFEYLTQVSSVFSSNIEWNTLDINSFMNFKMNNNITKEVEEIENLIEAYKFAGKNDLNEKNFLEVHNISSKTLLIKSKRWVYRDEKVWVFWKEWLIYLAIEAEFVKEKMKEFFEDIESLLKSDLSLEEGFYFASFIHLRFVHIHPFSDWNGRCARILEKWFLAEKFWKDLWKMKSEEYYKENIALYYKNINLWVNYYELNYDNCLYFLSMLPESLEN